MIESRASKEVRILYNFDSEYFRSFAGRRDEHWVELSPELPGRIMACLLDNVIHRLRPDLILDEIEFIQTTYLEAKQVETIESGTFELCFFRNYILFEQMFQGQPSDREWEDILVTREQFIAMLRSLLARLEGEGFVGTFELKGHVVAYGTEAKRAFQEMTGYWDDREYECDNSEDYEDDFDDD